MPTAVPLTEQASANLNGVGTAMERDKFDTARYDAMAISLISLVLFSIFVYHETFEKVVEFSKRYERWELDEVLTLAMILPVGLGIFAWRRLVETHSELEHRIRAEEHAQAMALHDPLTGLPNRRHAEREIAVALENVESHPIALLLIDLNRFKAINDLHGHGAGDKLLLETGQRLQACAGPDAFVARLGGDEFVVLINEATTGDELIHRVDTLSRCFDSAFAFDHGHSIVGAAIGVTFVDKSGLNADEVLTRADAAMYRCKAKGRNGYAFFEEGMEFAAIRRAEIEAELREAIAASAIEPFFQPLVSLGEGEIIGYEVLARWRLPDGSVRMPDNFIQIAEDCGLIGDLYYSMLEQSAAAAQEWPPDWRFAINVSPVQFDDEWLVPRTLQILTAAGVSPKRLNVEITESALVANIDQARHVIAEFKKQDIKVALDDFGTGYSSLRHLSELDFDQLKIDRSFIADLATNSSSQTIVRTISSLAHNLGLQVTVEGVETERQALDLKGYGADFGQGYFYGRPAPFDRGNPVPENSPTTVSETNPGRAA